MGLSSQKVPVPCQQCGFVFQQSIAGLKKNPSFTCPKCGTVTSVDARQFSREVGKVERALSEVEKALKKLGGR